METLVFMVTPRFWTESDKETDALPTVTESGKEKERDLDFRPEDTIIASVLSSFSLNLFNVIQDLMSSIHSCIERKRHRNDDTWRLLNGTSALRCTIVLS